MAAAASLSVEKRNIVWAQPPKDWTGAGTTDLYVSLKNYQHITIYIQTGAWAGGTAAVTLKQATAVAGTATKALAFSFIWTKTSATDLPTKVAVVSNTFNIDTANKLYIIEVDGSTLDVAGGFDCIACSTATPGSNSDFFSMLYELDDARQLVPLSCLID